MSATVHDNKDRKTANVGSTTENAQPQIVFTRSQPIAASIMTPITNDRTAKLAVFLTALGKTETTIPAENKRHWLTASTLAVTAGTIASYGLFGEQIAGAVSGALASVHGLASSIASDAMAGVAILTAAVITIARNVYGDQKYTLADSQDTNSILGRLTKATGIDKIEVPKWAVHSAVAVTALAGVFALTHSLYPFAGATFVGVMDKVAEVGNQIFSGLGNVVKNSALSFVFASASCTLGKFLLSGMIPEFGLLKEETDKSAKESKFVSKIKDFSIKGVSVYQTLVESVNTMDIIGNAFGWYQKKISGSSEGQEDGFDLTGRIKAFMSPGKFADMSNPTAFTELDRSYGEPTSNSMIMHVTPPLRTPPRTLLATGEMMKDPLVVACSMDAGLTMGAKASTQSTFDLGNILTTNLSVGLEVGELVFATGFIAFGLHTLAKSNITLDAWAAYGFDKVGLLDRYNQVKNEYSELKERCVDSKLYQSCKNIVSIVLEFTGNSIGKLVDLADSGLKKLGFSRLKADYESVSEEDKNLKIVSGFAFLTRSFAVTSLTYYFFNSAIFAANKVGAIFGQETSLESISSLPQLLTLGVVGTLFLVNGNNFAEKCTDSRVGIDEEGEESEPEGNNRIGLITAIKQFSNSKL